MILFKWLWKRFWDRWKYDIPGFRKKEDVNMYQIYSCPFGDCDWENVSKTEYYIKLVEEIKRQKKFKKNRDKEYKKAIQYLKSGGRK